MNYNELLHYPEGIAKIKLGVKGMHVNQPKWRCFNQGDSILLKEESNSLGNFYNIYINTEVIGKDIFSPTIKQQIAHIILTLIHSEYLFISEIQSMNIPSQLEWLGKNLHRIVILSGLDFFFDYKPSDINIYTTKNTSNKRSMWFVYDKRKKDKKDSIFDNAIKGLDFSKRIEFRLNRNNCEFLNLENLDYWYNNVLNRYQDLITRSWAKHKNRIAEVKITPYHLFFNNVISRSYYPTPNRQSLLRTDEESNYVL